MAEEPGKPYYATVKSSSEGEISSDEEQSKDDMLKTILPKPSENTEDELRKKLLKGRTHVNSSHSRGVGKSSSHTSPQPRKRLPIRAPSPEHKEKRHKDNKDVHKSKDKSSKGRIESVTTIVIEETVEMEVQRISTSSTPTFSDPPTPTNESPINLHVKLLSGQHRSNTGSPMPGSKQYSRFDSPEREVDTTEQVDNLVASVDNDDDMEKKSIEMRSSSEGESDPEQIEEVIVDENTLAAQSKNFEDLTEDEKKLLSPEGLKKKEDEYKQRLIALLPIYYPGIYGCRSINEFKLLNKISEGTFGVVYRALERSTDEIVALKQLKLEKEKEGFPITSLREINMLMKCRKHPNVVGLREIVTDSTGEKIYMSMEFVEHDLRALMKQLEGRKKRFKLAEVKTLMQQLLSGIAYMHGEWVIHRDLKTANLLLSHKNILKIGDFGLAREYGDPLKPYTSLVVTLHYRPPELLLGCHTYSTAVDVWSAGCIFGEFFKLNAIYPATSEAEQIKMIFEGVGTPSERTWPGYNDLQYVKRFNWPNYSSGQLRRSFFKDLKESEVGLDLMTKLLTACPERRISADDALKHAWFTENPLPAPSESFPTWPAKSENLKAPPKQPEQLKEQLPTIDPERLKLLQEFNIKPTKSVANSGFSLKMGR